jgi:hypothetical protein
MSHALLWLGIIVGVLLIYIGGVFCMSGLGTETGMTGLGNRGLISLVAGALLAGGCIWGLL